MDSEWLLRLPDLKDFSEEKPMDYFVNPQTGIIGLCAYGAADESLIIGMAIRYRHKVHRNLILYEYRLLDGSYPYYLRWLDEKDEEIGNPHYGAAIRGQNGVWRVKLANEIAIWKIDCEMEDSKIVKIKLAVPSFDIEPNSPENN